VEKEMLRIPSTRNAAILGRANVEDGGGEGFEKLGLDGAQAAREAKVLNILEREVGDVEDAGRDWVERARRIALSKGNCH
jgi:tRNASer (uridine44-2'-O)-methyltransferase